MCTLPTQEITGFKNFHITATANFTGTPLSGYAPLGVTFSDLSTGTAITNRSWNFGDGNVTNFTVSTNPYHIYPNPGAYGVTLTASNPQGFDVKEKIGYITVTPAPPAPDANFTGTPTFGTAPLTVTFTDNSTNSPTSWNWSFGDGATSGTRNPVHTYTTAGTYTVSLMQPTPVDRIPKPPLVISPSMQHPLPPQDQLPILPALPLPAQPH